MKKVKRSVRIDRGIVREIVRLSEEIARLRRDKFELSLELKKYQEVSQRLTVQGEAMTRAAQVRLEELVAAHQTTEQFREMASAFSHFADALWHRIEGQVEERIRWVRDGIAPRDVKKGGA